MVPIVGPVFTGVLAFLVAISDSWTLGISVIILFAVIQQMESHLLVPVVMRKTTGLHPVVVVISLLAGSQLGGFIGLILAVPSGGYNSRIYRRLGSAEKKWEKCLNFLIAIHIQFPDFNKDREEVIKRIFDADIGVVNVGADKNSSLKAVELAKKYPNKMWAAVGCHPHYIKEFDYEFFKKWLKKKRLWR